MGGFPPRLKVELAASDHLCPIIPAALQVILPQLKHGLHSQIMKLLPLPPQPIFKRQAVAGESRQKFVLIKIRGRGQVTCFNRLQKPANIQMIIPVGIKLHRLPADQQKRPVRLPEIPQQPAQLVKRLAQVIAGHAFRFVRPKKSGQHFARVGPVILQRKINQQSLIIGRAKVSDRPIVQRDEQVAKECHFKLGHNQIIHG